MGVGDAGRDLRPRGSRGLSIRCDAMGSSLTMGLSPLGSGTLMHVLSSLMADPVDFHLPGLGHLCVVDLGEV